MNEILIIVDCNYLCYVNKYSMSSGLSYRGDRTEIIFGVFRQILDLARQFETTHFAFCWDSKISLRKEIFADYKANRHLREKTEEERIADKIAYQQFDELRTTALYEFGFNNVFLKEGYEGDDIIASIVKNRINSDNIVVSSDQDLLQLLDKCSLYNITKKEMATEEIFRRTYGIEPKQWAEAKYISGCSTDNVPGVANVGEKTAIRFITGKLTKGQTYDKIVLFKEHFRNDFERNKKLILLPFDGTGIFPIRKPKVDWSKNNFIDFCKKYGFKSFMAGKYIDEWAKVFKMH